MRLTVSGTAVAGHWAAARDAPETRSATRGTANGLANTFLEDAEMYKIRVTKSIKIRAPDEARSGCGQSDCPSGNPLAAPYASTTT